MKHKFDQKSINLLQIADNIQEAQGAYRTFPKGSCLQGMWWAWYVPSLMSDSYF